jgi:hypothetical protein
MRDNEIEERKNSSERSLSLEVDLNGNQSPSFKKKPPSNTIFESSHLQKEERTK